MTHPSNECLTVRELISQLLENCQDLDAPVTVIHAKDVVALDEREVGNNCAEVHSVTHEENMTFVFINGEVTEPEDEIG